MSKTEKPIVMPEWGSGPGGSGRPFVETPSGRLRYAKSGEGPETLVLVHGFGGDLDTWFFNAPALAEHATVFAFDLPGHGQSTKALVDPTLAGLSRALLEFMDAVGIESAHLGGHSMGGAVCMRTALDQPGRVKSLSLLASAGLGPEVNASFLKDFVLATSAKALKPVLEQLFWDKSLVTPEIIEIVLTYKRMDGVTQALEALMWNLFADGRQADILATAIAASGKPTLVVFGDKDEIIPPSHVDALKGAARAVTVPLAGHLVQMEGRSTINELVARQVASAA